MVKADFESECFFLTPIGAEGSETRRRSDVVLKFIVRPAAQEVGLAALRADELAQPGQITLHVIEHLLRARAAVADLTAANPNVYWELVVRHASRLAVVLIADDDERPLPFDIAGMRVVFFDHTDLESAANCRDEIVVQLRGALDGAFDSPISTLFEAEAVQKAWSTERALVELRDRVDYIGRQVENLRLREAGQAYPRPGEYHATSS